MLARGNRGSASIPSHARSGERPPVRPDLRPGLLLRGLLGRRGRPDLLSSRTGAHRPPGRLPAHGAPGHRRAAHRGLFRGPERPVHPEAIWGSGTSSTSTAATSAQARCARSSGAAVSQWTESRRSSVASSSPFTHRRASRTTAARERSSDLADMVHRFADHYRAKVEGWSRPCGASIGMDARLRSGAPVPRGQLREHPGGQGGDRLL